VGTVSHRSGLVACRHYRRFALPAQQYRDYPPDLKLQPNVDWNQTFRLTGAQYSDEAHCLRRYCGRQPWRGFRERTVAEPPCAAGSERQFIQLDSWGRRLIGSLRDLPATRRIRALGSPCATTIAAIFLARHKMVICVTATIWRDRYTQSGLLRLTRMWLRHLRRLPSPPREKKR
jgi:hypothetical protein